jgi:hypothetical protein
MVPLSPWGGGGVRGGPPPCWWPPSLGAVCLVWVGGTALAVFGLSQTVPPFSSFRQRKLFSRSGRKEASKIPQWPPARGGRCRSGRGAVPGIGLVAVSALCSFAFTVRHRRPRGPHWR